MLVKIVLMLFGLIRANSDVRIFEEPSRYRRAMSQKKEGKSRNKNTNRRSDPITTELRACGLRFKGW